MIFAIECPDKFLQHHLHCLVKDKSQSLLFHNNELLFKIQISNINKKLFFETNFSPKITINIPCHFREIYNAIEIIQNLYEINLDLFKYNPFKQKIYNKKVDVFLNDIHNKILLCLIINKNGINKIELYKLLWINDKNLNLNKLDTHLTNLKNLLKSEIDFNLNFKSKNSILVMQ